MQLIVHGQYQESKQLSTFNPKQLSCKCAGSYTETKQPGVSRGFSVPTSNDKGIVPHSSSSLLVFLQ